ncbi:oxidized low-density lipoprotein receptor 1-like [Adelges cooleyi]|uniref:oxidized low-density lipoprotein receptor 1-like n=1 Tax=Adelges cooleyi TaxID=133065 RepID=UPI00217F4B9E|nr:oxidized low-density lipoprotein receptor 1-like [Adelges cooleyi]
MSFVQITCCVYVVMAFTRGVEMNRGTFAHRLTTIEDLATRDNVINVPVSALPTGYVVNRPNPTIGDRVDVNKEVSETDMYLLGAIEKLVHRMDLMDKRLKRSEELIQHVLEGNAANREDPCPGNFTRISHTCYHFSERQYNWKSAMSMCKSLGGNLLEFDNKEEQIDVLTFLISDKYLRGYDYWTGGLNPGLLWIWANSARPVVPKDSNRPEDQVNGSGRCLRLALNPASKVYAYSGAECSNRHRYICKHEENATDKALTRIHKALRDDRERYLSRIVTATT